MRKIWVLQFLYLAAALAAAWAQEQRGTISGRVLAAGSRTPVAYAHVILFGQPDSVMVTGAATHENGQFQLSNLPPGNYYLTMQCLGYKTKRHGPLALTPNHLKLDLGDLTLQPTALRMETVEVQADAMAMTYQADKKIINVSQQQTALSGTAVDVLENVPSVAVDIEGNVSLRGSGSFTLLIDGRPAILEPSEALQQIPASTIENIEIMTNPSAKYNPEGAAGIINVILKKEQRSGTSGMANLNAGTGDKYGGDLMYDRKQGDQHVTLSLDYNRRLLTGSEREYNQTTSTGLTSFTTAQGGSQRQDLALGARGEWRWDFGRSDFLNFGGRYGYRDSHREYEQDYTEWTTAAAEQSSYQSSALRERNRNFYALALTYLHRFAPHGHELTTELYFSRRTGDEATSNGLLTPQALVVEGRRITEAGPSRNLQWRLDYTRTLGENTRLEAGWHSDFDRAEDRVASFVYDTALSTYVPQPQFSSQTFYDENVHALYALCAGQWRRWEYQAGLRAEYTDRDIAVRGEPASFALGRWDYFPTLHLSRQFAAGQQLMGSYTRRIDRPNGGELEPFLTWRDAYNVYVGNPALQPEFIDSYEIGFRTALGPSTVSAEAYYRRTRNRIERIRSVYEPEVTLHAAENAGNEEALGSELGWNYRIGKKWEVNVTGNLYRFRLAGAAPGDAWARESFNWSTRWNNVFKFTTSTQIQFDILYDSPTISTQGRRTGIFFANAALKYEIFPKLLSATLQVRDVFASAKRESMARGVDFYNYSYSRREAPVAMFNLRYNFNNYKSERERETNREGQGEEDF